MNGQASFRFLFAEVVLVLFLALRLTELSAGLHGLLYVLHPGILGSSV